jgi:hypothetical protein
MNPTDETTLARFAGGDMSIAEETEFLACCEIEPDLWRTAALALVEHRQVVSALREFAGDRSNPSINAASRTSSRIKMRWPTMFAVAASLLAIMVGGLSVAYRAGQRQSTDVQLVNRDSPDAAAETAEPSVVVYLQTPNEPDYPGAVQDQSPAIPSTEEMATRLAAMNSRPVLPAEARSLLRQAGVEVDEEPVLYVLDDGSGERWAVPTRNLHLRFVNHQD